MHFGNYEISTVIVCRRNYLKTEKKKYRINAGLRIKKIRTNLRISRNKNEVFDKENF